MCPMCMTGIAVTAVSAASGIGAITLLVAKWRKLPGLVQLLHRIIGDAKG